MKHLARSLLCILSTTALLLPPVSQGQNLAEFGAGKTVQYTQSGPNLIGLGTAEPYEFNAIAAFPGSLTTPSSQVIQLTYYAPDQAYEVIETYGNQSTMDAAFPSGTYTFTLPGQPVVGLRLNGDLYPVVPQVVGGSWNSSGQLLVDPASDVRINFNAFPTYATQGVQGYAEFMVNGSAGTSVIDTTWLTPTDPQAPTGITIPAGSLAAGSTYSVSLNYGTDTDVDFTTLPGSLLFTAYIVGTNFMILAEAPPAVAPTATLQPVGQTIASGATVVFQFAAGGPTMPTYQWYLNGAAIPLETSPTLYISGATAANAGTYTCVATGAAGSVTSAAAPLSVITTSNPGRLINLSARAQVGTGGNIIFGGFAVGPLGGAGSLPVLIRGSGPAIGAAPFNVPGTLPDPQLQLFDSTNVVIHTNNGWAGDAAIASAAAAVGAFSWGSPTSHDAAFDLSLGRGTYTAQIAGQSGDTGDALVEVYDATPAGTYTPSMPRLINLSARVDVGTGANALFAGFVIGGSTSLTVLIRASGPAIAAAPFNVPGTLSDPALKLQNPATGAVFATNSGWAGDSNISGVANSVGAFRWSNPSSQDSAILMTLPPGNYTAAASGAGGDSGVAIVEVYEVP